jgi:hypothetical protein
MGMDVTYNLSPFVKVVLKGPKGWAYRWFFYIGLPLVVRIIGVPCLCSCYSTDGKNGYFNNDVWPLVLYQSFKKFEPWWVMFSKIVYNNQLTSSKGMTNKNFVTIPFQWPPILHVAIDASIHFVVHFKRHMTWTWLV